MPKLSDIIIDSSLFRGRGIRPWNDTNVVKPHSQESVSNTLAKHEQYVSNTLAQPLAKSEQTVSKSLAKNKQTNKPKKDTVSNTLAQPLAEALADREQYVSKPLANLDKTKNNELIETLVGNEKNLLMFLFQKCQLLGSLESPAITTDELKNTLKISANHLRNLIHRMLNKNVVEVSKIKNGRAGWRKFILSKEVFQSLSLDQSVSNTLANRKQYVSNTLVQPLAEPLAISSSSGSNIFNTTTTDDNKKQPQSQIPAEWQDLDIEPLSKIGFTKNHLNQIALQLKLSPKEVQNSIYAFVFDLKENGKKKEINKDPISFFMGVLRNSGGYLPPSNYESPQERYRRLYAERMREVEAKNAAIEQEAFDLAFKDWFRKLTYEQKIELLPEMLRRHTDSEKLEKSKRLEAYARSHFEKELWLDIKNKIESVISA